jgi:hypothetical protein
VVRLTRASPTVESMTLGMDEPEDADHRLTSITVGAVALAWKRLAGTRDRLTPRDRLSLRDVAVGVVFDLEDVIVGLFTLGRLRAGGARTEAVRRATDTMAMVRARAAGLAGRGADERERGRQAVTTAMQTIVETLATSPTVDRVIDAQIDRTVRPLMVTVLDDILALLEAEPDRVRSIIRGQRDSIVDDLVTHLREDAAAGDRAVDRLAARAMGRPSAP